MEKRRPTYDLEAFKRATDNPKKLPITRTAFASALALGFGPDEIVDALQELQRRHFYKSMTSHRDHRLWQDVYHLPWNELVLYVKFTADAVTEFTLLSFKERDDA
jgi:motility quorum-sensing regulator/GCU-specific mRNA interferase toxin